MNFIQHAEALVRNYLNVTPEIVINSLELGLLAYIFWRIYLWRSSEKNLPPGPVGLPIFGYLPFLGKEAYRTLHDLTFTYGPIFSLYLGRRLVVVLGNFEVVKEALSNNDILDRPKNPPNHLLPDSTSLSVSNGQVWKEQRLTSVRILRNLGMEKPAMEIQIQEELSRLTKEIDSKQGHAMNLDEVLLPSVSNNILAMLIGHSLDYKHKDRIFLNNILKTMVLYFRPTRLHAYFPSAKFWMAKFKIWGYDQMQDKMNSLGNFLEEIIKKHKEHFDKQFPTSYIDAYLLTMADRDKN
ncbi:Cytochrome P450 2C37, partial [Stegodyphus mimosarum]